MKIVLMKIQFNYQTKRLTLMKHHKLLLRRLTHEESRINDIFKKLQSFKDFQLLVRIVDDIHKHRGLETKVTLLHVL